MVIQVFSTILLTHFAVHNQLSNCGLCFADYGINYSKTLPLSYIYLHFKLKI